MVRICSILTGEDPHRCSMLEYKVAPKDEVQAIPFGMCSGGVWIFGGKDIVEFTFVEEGGEIWIWTGKVGIHSKDNAMSVATELKDMECQIREKVCSRIWRRNSTTAELSVLLHDNCDCSGCFK